MREPVLLQPSLPLFQTPHLAALIVPNNSQIPPHYHLIISRIDILPLARHPQTPRDRLAVLIEQPRQPAVWTSRRFERFVEGQPVAAVGEGFAGFGWEGLEAGVGRVAEGVEVGLLFFFVDGAVCAYEKLVVGVVAGYARGVPQWVGDAVGW